MSKLLILLICVAVSFSAKQDCVQMAKKTEICIREAMFMGNTKVPHTVAEWNSYSRVFSKAVKCLKDYRVCNKGILRQVYGIFVSGVVKFGKEAFGKNSDVNKYLNAVQCFDEKTMSEMRKCMYAYTSRVNYIKNDKTLTDVFPKLCCTIRLMDECVKVTVNDCKVGKKEAVSFTTRLLNSFFGDATELMCGKQANVKVCDTVYPKYMASLRNVTTKRLKKDEFILVSSVELIEMLL